MSEPVNHQDDSQVGSSKPSDNSRWLKIRNWLVRIIVILVLATVVEKVVEQVADISSGELTEINHSFVNGVSAVNAFRLAGLFYGYLLNGEPPAPRPTRALNDFRIYAPEPPPKLSYPLMAWRIIPGAFYTAKTIVSEGWVSIFTALVALFIGFACMWSGLKEEGSLSSKLLMLLVVPLIGSVFVWLLLTIMWLFGLLFGWLLVSAQTVTYFGFVGAIVKAVVKEREHHLTGKIIARLTGQH